MFKFLLAIASGVIAGILGTLFTLNWQEERLYFDLGETAKFGNITYQNLRISNEGWNPATNVKVYLNGNGNGVPDESIKPNPRFDIKADKPLIGGYERIRRGEVVSVTFAFEGEPLPASIISIKSDRSIAAQRVASTGVPLTAKIAWFAAGSGFWVLIGVIAAIAIPATHQYKRRRAEATQKAG